MTWAQAFRDIFIASMNKGQILPMTLSLFVLIGLFRMPSEDVTKVAMACVGLIRDHSIFGYGLCAVSLFAWSVHAKIVRAMHNAESGRIGKEKTKLQEQLGGAQLPSSRRRGG